MKKYRAFSLVEISISVSIIAIIISGIIAASRIKDRANIQQIITDINLFSSAVTNFEDNYIAIAGDYDQASTSFSLTNGNGNGELEAGTPNEELLFWQHLVGAGYIDGTFDGTTIGKGGLYEGPFANSFYHAETEIGNNEEVIILFSNLQNGSLYDPALKAKDIAYFDAKYDDGRPLTGKIRAIDAGTVDEFDCVTEDGDYNLSFDTEKCVMQYFTGVFDNRIGGPEA